jgi:hypothetical protein
MFKNPSPPLPKTKTCPVNKMMKKLNDDYKDSTRLKIDEASIFDKAVPKPKLKKSNKAKKRK